MGGRSSRGPRTLVRWNDDLDKTILLTMNYAATESGIKLPWDRVAEILGPAFTEGAITQHIARLRARMIELGHPVPPRNERGSVVQAPSRVYTAAVSAKKRKKVGPLFPDSRKVTYTSGEDVIKVDEDDIDPLALGQESTDLEVESPAGIIKVEPGKVARGKPHARAKTAKSRTGRSRGASEEAEEGDEIPELFDSDEEYGPSSKKKQRKSAASSRAKKNGIAASAAKGKVTAKNSIAITQEKGSSMRTRGIKCNYAVDDYGTDHDIAETVPDVTQNPQVEVTEHNLDRNHNTVKNGHLGDAKPTFESHGHDIRAHESDNFNIVAEYKHLPNPADVLALPGPAHSPDAGAIPYNKPFTSNGFGMAVEDLQMNMLQPHFPLPGEYGMQAGISSGENSISSTRNHSIDSGFGMLQAHHEFNQLMGLNDDHDGVSVRFEDFLHESFFSQEEGGQDRSPFMG